MRRKQEKNAKKVAQKTEEGQAKHQTMNQEEEDQQVMKDFETKLNEKEAKKTVDSLRSLSQVY